jgi:hypothetical protein
LGVGLKLGRTQMVYALEMRVSLIPPNRGTAPTHIDVVRLCLAKAEDATLSSATLLHRGARASVEGASAGQCGFLRRAASGAARLPPLGTAIEERRATVWECVAAVWERGAAWLLPLNVTRSNGVEEGG